MSGRVRGKVALITGGASGIGRGCAEKLASEGAVVVITDLQDAKGAEVVAAIEAAGGKAFYLHHDCTDETAWETVIGEIKRYFPDKRGHVHVERAVQELLLEVREAKNELVQQLRHNPSDAEIAAHLGATEAAVREALRADMLMQPSSLDAPLAGQPDAATLADLLGEDDPAVEHTLSMEALGAHWDELPRREQKILLMRFYGDMTQAEIGSKLGISQMHVSRLLAHALTYLRGRILGPAEAELAASA